MARQYFIPGIGIVNDAGAGREYLIPDCGFIFESVAVSSITITADPFVITTSLFSQVYIIAQPIAISLSVLTQKCLVASPIVVSLSMFTQTYLTAEPIVMTSSIFTHKFLTAGPVVITSSIFTHKYLTARPVVVTFSVEHIDLTLGTAILVPEWAKNYRSLGPWSFIEQPDKWGYLNNPRWYKQPLMPAINYTGNYDAEPQKFTPLTDDGPFSSNEVDRHSPCGHWHKRKAVAAGSEINVNIYGLFRTGATIWGVYFDGETLTYIGRYKSPDYDINGLVWHGDHLLTIAGSLSTARLRELESEPENGLFPVYGETTPFNNYDVVGPDYGAESVLTIDDSGLCYVGSSGRIVQLSNLNTRTSRGFYGSVITGTDSNLYVEIANCMWLEDYHPITGEYWDVFWDLIPDNLNDGPITVWGVDGYIASISQVMHIATDYFIYVSQFQSPNSYLKKLRRVTTGEGNIYELIKDVTQLSFGTHICLYNNVIFLGSGVMASCTVYKYNAEDLSVVDSLSITNRGRMPRVAITTSGKLLVGTDVYTEEVASLFRINPNTMQIEDSMYFGGTRACQALLPLNERYVAVGHNSSIAVYDYLEMKLIDEVDYLLLGLPTAYAHICLISKTI